MTDKRPTQYPEGGGDSPLKAPSVREDKFIDEWLRDFNGTRAYLKAYGTKSRKAARVAAARKLQEPHIKQAIAERQEDIRRRARVDIDWVVAEEMKLASANIKDVFDGHWTLTSPDQLTDEVGSTVASVEVKESGTDPDTGEVQYLYRYKLWDKGKALERLGRHLGMYSDRIQAEIDLGSLDAIRGMLRDASEDDIRVMANFLQRLGGGGE
jgi:phage terminase small subunit